MRLILAATVSLLGLAVLLSLGFWQLARLDWKESLLAEMDARLLAEPGPVPDDPDPVADRFRPVRAEGVFLDAGVAVFGTWRGGGAGYRIISPFRTEDGRSILVDRGIAASPDAGVRYADGPVAVEGNLDWPEGTAPPPRGLTNVWTTRNVGALARNQQTEPILLVARATSDPTGGIVPIPIDTAGIPNNHLGYAVQWFGLALVWAGMAGYWFWRALRRGEVR